MNTQPKTKYAKSKDLNIAYQVIGEGSVDLVFIPGWVSHVEHVWDNPYFADFLRRLASFSRLIILDRRGLGLSDPVSELPTLEERMDDIRAVMDAAQSESAALLGVCDSASLCAVFAATFPHKVKALILHAPLVNDPSNPGVPYGITERERDLFLKQILLGWGRGRFAKLCAPDLAHDKNFIEEWGRFERRSVSPKQAHLLYQMVFDSDVSQCYPIIRVPTLITQRQGDCITKVDGARYISGQIPDAKYVELQGNGHWPWIGDADSILLEMEEFLTGTRRSSYSNRKLATILFSDIVGSTDKASKCGDVEWKNILQSFYGAATREIRRYQGEHINNTGDGFLATFDGPARGIKCALAISNVVSAYNLSIRVGLHTGECEVVENDIRGIAVHIAARVMAIAEPDEVLVSSTVKDLVVGSGLQFSERGTHELKGVPDSWRLFSASL
jgi:class 3 adenylate cyclase/pimeloyl-ACP methyl ester carboxylesterase